MLRSKSKSYGNEHRVKLVGVDVSDVDEDFAIDGLKLIGAWSEHLRDDVLSLPRRRELVQVLVALDEVEHQVPNTEGPTPYSMAVVPA